MLRLSLLLAALAVAAAAALPPPALRVAGSSALLPLLEASTPALRVAFGPRITVGALGSSFGLTSLLRRSADLALADIPLGARGIVRRPVARLYLAVIAAPGLPRQISLAGLRAVLQGRVRSWAALGGPPRALQLVLRTPGSGARARLQAFAGGRLTAGSLQAASSGQVAALVGQLPGGIGVVESAYAPPGLTLRLGGLLPGQAGYALAYEGFALYRRGDARGDLAALIVAAQALREASR